MARLSGHIETATTRVPGGRARELLALPDAKLIEALAPKRKGEIAAELAEFDPGPLRERIRVTGCWSICRHLGIYPRGLRHDRQAPPALFGRGKMELLERLGADTAVTLVGARRPSAYGREVSTALGRQLASAGLVVVSGMALGIDSCAHRGALEAGGLTVAVLGNGPDLPYPARLRKLYGGIAEQGLVMSELPPGTQPRRWTFPARNRVMAALGAITVVVEARDRSGSLITADMASDLGREVGAVPGRVGHSPAAGVNGLLREGAALIRNAEDVLDTLIASGVHVPHRTLPAARRELDAGLAPVVDAVEQGAETLDAISRQTGIAPGSAAAAAARLELLGVLSCDSAGRYRRAAT